MTLGQLGAVAFGAVVVYGMYWLFRLLTRPRKPEANMDQERETAE